MLMQGEPVPIRSRSSSTVSPFPPTWTVSQDGPGTRSVPSQDEEDRVLWITQVVRYDAPRQRPISQLLAISVPQKWFWQSSIDRIEILWSRLAYDSIINATKRCKHLKSISDVREGTELALSVQGFGGLRDLAQSLLGLSPWRSCALLSIVT